MDKLSGLSGIGDWGLEKSSMAILGVVEMIVSMEVSLWRYLAPQRRILNREGGVDVGEQEGIISEWSVKGKQMGFIAFRGL